MKRQRILEEWQNFSRYVMPDGASAEQQKSMRGSFFAGASFAFGVIVMGLPDNEPEAHRILTEFREEFEAYFARCSKGVM